jgi:glycosyltransferase
MPQKISVITVSLNNFSTINATISSVLSQNYPNVEYIIIDGGSTDGTREVIESYRHQIEHIVSEADQGMYDAMNKGVSLATGDVVGILNADDVYAGNDILQRVADCFQQEAVEAVYGDLAYVRQDDPERVTRFWKAGAYTPYTLYYGWMPPHPTFFVRRRCYLEYSGYRTDLGTSADYELMLRFLLCHRVVPVYLPGLMVKMRTGGASNSTLAYRIQAHLMDWRAWRVNGLQPRPWTLLLKPLRKVTQWFARN